MTQYLTLFFIGLTVGYVWGSADVMAAFMASAQ